MELNNISFSSWWSFGIYITFIIFIAILIRVLLCVFKALSIRDGEHLLSSGTSYERELKRGRFKRQFCIVFKGLKKDYPNINDYWLPTIVGFCELFIYPLFLKAGFLTIIGGWIAIKTTGQWRVWGQSRTAFNRYLVGNLIVILFSYLLMRQFIEISKINIYLITLPEFLRAHWPVL